jgi:hypothetical protein
MWIDYFLKGKYLPDIDGKNKFLFVFLFLACNRIRKPPVSAEYFKKGAVIFLLQTIYPPMSLKSPQKDPVHHYPGSSVNTRTGWVSFSGNRVIFTEHQYPSQLGRRMYGKIVR